MTRAAAFFDLDKTLMAGSSGMQFARVATRQGIVGRRQLASWAVEHMRYRLRGTTDERTSEVLKVARELITGVPETRIARMAPEVMAEILPRIAAGECFFVIGMSEPDSGSDLASIRTRATRNGDGDWVVNGAKVWTSNAHHSHYAINLVRTSAADPANRHAGLSQLLVDLSLPGITINPIRILDGGHHFNEVVFDDVVVSGDMLLGEEGNGWHQVTAELAFERSGPERFLSTYPLIAEFGRRAAMTGDPAQLATLGRLAARLLALRQMSLRIAAALDRGELPDIAAALVKDVGTTFEADVIDEVRRVVEVVPSLDSPDPLGRALAEAQLHQPGFTLRGGTNEILKGIVARGLGLR